MPQATQTTTSRAAPHKASKAAKPAKTAAKPAKATKWGKDMLGKMEAFRKALAAQ
jgi:hypothetical protein